MISLIKQPNKYTPVNNPVIFQMQSDNANIQFFQVKVNDASANTISSLRLYTSPGYINGSYADLSNILSNTVDYQLNPSVNAIDTAPAILQAFELVITEKLYSGGGIVDGSTTTTGLYYTFNGLIDRVTFCGYNYKNYVLTPSATTVNILTNKPGLSTLYQNSTEYLYFLNDGFSGNTQLSFYGVGHTLLGSHSLPLTASTQTNRIDISPANLYSNFGVNFSNLYGGEFADAFDSDFGSNFTIASTNYFTVTLTDVSGNTKSPVRTYVLKNSPCSYVPIQLLFSNQLGGFDGITFFNPREEIAVTKTSIGRNPIQPDGSNVYSDINNNIFNEDNSVLTVGSVSTFKAITANLTDAESIWLKELVKAEKVYIYLKTGQFLPITVTNLNYPVQQKKYLQALNRLELSFTIPDTGISIF